MKKTHGLATKKGPVRAPIPFRDRTDLYNGGKMLRAKHTVAASPLQSYLNVKKTDNERDKGGEAWFSNLNVYIDPTSATSFMNRPDKAVQASADSPKAAENKIKWTARDDPALWREFLIVVFLLAVTVAFCFGLINYTLKHNIPEVTG